MRTGTAKRSAPMRFEQYQSRQPLQKRDTPNGGEGIEGDGFLTVTVTPDPATATATASVRGGQH